MARALSRRLVDRMALLAGVCLGAAIVALGTPVAHADVIVRYGFPTSGGTTSSSPVSEAHADATPTNYSAHGGTAIGTTGTHYIRVDTSTNGVDNTDRLASIDSAFLYGVYGEFSITAKSGMWLNLDSLDFGMRNDRGVTGQSFSVHLRSSLDGYASDIASRSQVRVNDDTVQGPDPMTIELTDETFQKLTETVTFRLYMVTDIANNTASSENVRIMPNIVLNGTVAPVPEPGVLALAGVGGMLLLGRRRHARSA